MSDLLARLDLLPLAIELAAARLKLFGPEQLLDRLSERLDLLKGGRDVDARQQTLRATIEWSYTLLEPEEQRLLRALSVFAGGCTLAAVEAVCDAGPEQLQSLLDKSLLRRVGDNDPRYGMLETVGEFARGALRTTEDVAPYRRHARYFRDMALSAEHQAKVHAAAEWLERIESERHNFHAALDWMALAGDVEDAFETFAALYDLFVHRHHVQQGLRLGKRCWLCCRTSPSAREAAGRLRRSRYVTGDLARADEVR